jgi:hypothetical protein
MGTSKSSSGPGMGVGLVPPWLDIPQAPAPQPYPQQGRPPGNGQGNPDLGLDVPQAPPPRPQAQPAAAQGDFDGTPAPAPRNPQPMPAAADMPDQGPVGEAPARRFVDARTAVGKFIRTGERSQLRKGLGHYVRKGYRGSGIATARMGQSATSAGRAYEILSGLADGIRTPQQIGFDPALLAGAPVDDVIDALVDAICTNDTTLDDIAGREAVSDALSEVLGENPDLDPFAMPPEHIQEVWLRTLAYHVFEDLMLDLGTGLQNGAAGDAVLFNDRKFEIRAFILENYREQLEAFDTQGRVLDRASCDAIAREVNGQVFHVYEGWFE